MAMAMAKAMAMTMAMAMAILILMPIRTRCLLSSFTVLRLSSQDEIARIRKRKRGRNTLTVLDTRRITCVSVTSFVTFSRVSVAAYTTEPDHFLCMLNITETWSCMFPARFRNTETCDFVLCLLAHVCIFFKILGRERQETHTA